MAFFSSPPSFFISRALLSLPSSELSLNPRTLKRSHLSHQADGDDDGYTKGHNGALAGDHRRQAPLPRARRRGAAAALAGAAGLGWAVSTGALSLPAAGDMLSRAALKSEVAKQVRSGN